MIDNPTFITGEKEKKSIDHQLDRLQAYLENPMDSSVMVFFAPYEKLDQRKKIVKQLKKVAVLLDASELSERDVRQYIKDYLRSQQYGIQEEALNTLLIKTQYSLTTCMKELDKLMVAEIGTYSIRLETVEALVAKTLEQSIFDFGEAILNKDSKRALQIYQNERDSIRSIPPIASSVVFEKSRLPRTRNSKDTRGAPIPGQTRTQPMPSLRNAIARSSFPAISRNRVRIENQRWHQRNAIGMVHPPILRPKNVIVFVIKGVDMSTITLHLNHEEERLFNEFALYKGEDLSYLLKSALLEKIHQEFVQCYEKSKNEGLVLMSHEDFWKEVER